MLRAASRQIKQGTEALSPATLEELPTSASVSLKADPSPVEPSDKTSVLANVLCSLGREAEAEDTAKLRYIPDT